MPTIKGLVRDLNTKKPIAGAFVSFNGYTARTDGQGNFTLTIPAKSYNLRATAQNYTGHSSILAISVDGQVIIDMIPTVKML